MVPAGIVAFAFLLIALPVSASVIDSSFTRSEFNLLNGARTDIDFQSFGYAPGQWSTYHTAAGLTVGGVNFVGALDPGYMLVLSYPTPGADDFGSGTRLRSDMTINSYLLLTMPAQVNAFGVDLASFFPGAASFRIELDGVGLGIVIPTQNAPNLTFFGVLTDTPFSQVRIYLAAGSVSTTGLFDNFAFITGASAPGGEAEVGETPEIASMIAVGTGLFLLGWKRHRSLALA